MSGRIPSPIGEICPGSALFNELPWDGILDSGEEISNGIYVYRVTATDGESTVDAIEKMAVLK